MKTDDVYKTAFAMALTHPSYPPGPYKFVNREYMIISGRTDIEALRAVVPDGTAMSVIAPFAARNRATGSYLIAHTG